MFFKSISLNKFIKLDNHLLSDYFNSVLIKFNFKKLFKFYYFLKLILK